MFSHKYFHVFISCSLINTTMKLTLNWFESQRKGLVCLVGNHTIGQLCLNCCLAFWNITATNSRSTQWLFQFVWAQKFQNFMLRIILHLTMLLAIGSTCLSKSRSTGQTPHVQFMIRKRLIGF